MKKTVAKYLCIILSVAMLVTALPLTVHAANTWDPDNGVYNITTEDDLFAFNEAFWTEGMYYEGVEVNLLADITISKGRDWVSAPSNAGVESIFAGTFNGNNHTISNLNMVSSDYSTVSFLPLLYDATIKDLTLRDVIIENGYTWNAAFACISYSNDTISNCHLTGNCIIKPYDGIPDTKSNFNGGIVGSKYSGTLKIENCSVGDAESDIKINTHDGNTSRGQSHSGGVLGFVRKGAKAEILSTDNYADINCDAFAGGIIGTINGFPNALSIGKVIDCRNYGDICSGENNSYGSSCCAGIVGYESMDSLLLIDRCANHGNITLKCNSALDSGGVAGFVGCGAVLNSYNTGKVFSSKEVSCIGGVVGHFRVDDGFQMPDTSIFDYYPENCINAIINCYNTGEVVGNFSSVGGICGYVQDIYTLPGKSIIKNAYNFADVSGNDVKGSVSGCNQGTKLLDIYAQNGDYAIGGIEIDPYDSDGVEGNISMVGYFDTPDVTGKVYSATVRSKAADQRRDFIEEKSDTPLSGNLLYLLNEKVKEYNAELEANGSDFRYLTWKMTNPASEDGSTGVSVHPMFGINDFTVNFYANFEDNEEPFRIYTVETLVNSKVPEFYDLPSHDGYIFKGWYLDKENSDDDSPISFDTVYSASTDIYAHWIKVENVAKDANDDNELPPTYNNSYGGFDLAGVQVREGIRDTNYGYEKMPGGLRFVTSLNMDVVNQINAIKPNNIEYGYVAATNEGWINYHSKDADRKLQYVSNTANGIDTSATAADENYFGFASNINCTSRVSNGSGKVKEDHRNFESYLLYTLVITYENVNDDAKDKNVLARPYIRYSDANGLERVAYSEYRGTNILGGCYTSYTAIAGNN